MNKQRLHSIATMCAVIVLENAQVVVEHVKANNIDALLTTSVVKKALNKSNTPIASNDRDVVNSIIGDEYFRSVFREAIKSNFNKIKLY